MGHRLRAALGAGYYALGFAFDGGAFRARDGAAPGRPLGAFAVGPAPDEWVDWMLARAGAPPYVVDLRAARPRCARAPWPRGSRRRRRGARRG